MPLRPETSVGAVADQASSALDYAPAAAGISLFGALGALAIALRTHAAAPLCGLSAVGHCPACYAALALGLFGAALAMAPLLARRR